MIKKRVLTIWLVLSVIALITACGINESENVANNEYYFTLIESSGDWGGRPMKRDPVNLDCLYIMASDQRGSPAYFIKLNTGDGTITALTIDHLFDGDYNYRVFDLFPLADGGYYIYAETLTQDKQILKRVTADLEPMYEIDLLDHIELTYSEIFRSEVYAYAICGLTDNGDPVIRTPEAVFTISPNGEKNDTWEYVNEMGNRVFVDALVSLGDILLCDYDAAFNVINLSWLRPGGVIEPYAVIDSISSTVMLDNGVIYVAMDPEQILYRLNEQGEKEFLLDYSDGRSYTNLHEIIALSDGRYIGYTSQGYFIIGKTNGDAQSADSIERKVITIATYGHNSPLISEQALSFNNQNDEYKIEIIDYSIFDDGVTRLNVEFIAGTAPDMIYWGYGKAGIVANFNPEIYSRAGVLVDLYEHIDGDDDMDRDSLLPNLLEALESTSGELFEMPISYILQLYAGSVDVLGIKPGWTFGEYFALLEAHPEAILPFGNGNWQLFLWDALSNNYEAFIDWEKGEAHFDTAEFAGLLQMATVYWDSTGGRLDIKNIQEGKQLLGRRIIGNVSSIQSFAALFGTEVNIIGFPTTKGIGNSFVLNGSISINAASDYADECWEFIKTLLAYDVQLNPFIGFPVNRAALAERLDNPEKYEEAGVTAGYTDSEGDRWSITYTDATPEEIATVRGLIESIDRIFRDNSDIMTIIEEVAPSYFSGDRTLEDTVGIIQSRVQVYVSERSW